MMCVGKIRKFMRNKKTKCVCGGGDLVDLVDLVDCGHPYLSIIIQPNWPGICFFLLLSTVVCCQPSCFASQDSDIIVLSANKAKLILAFVCFISFSILPPPPQNSDDVVGINGYRGRTLEGSQPAVY